MRRVIRSVVSVAIVALALNAKPAYADSVFVNQLLQVTGSTGSLGGGPFQVDLNIDGSQDLLSFCLQLTQTISYNTPFRIGAISNAADDAGGPDPIDERTAWIYTNFRTTPGFASLYSANAFQAAIWSLEEGYNASGVTGALALLQAANAAIANGWTSGGTVKVLNLFWANGTPAQDILVMVPVPEPTSMLLLGTGIAAVAARRRKQRQQAQA